MCRRTSRTGARFPPEIEAEITHLLETPGFVTAVAIVTSGASVSWREALSMTLPERIAFIRAAQEVEREREKQRPRPQQSPSPRRGG